MYTLPDRYKQLLRSNSCVHYCCLLRVAPRSKHLAPQARSSQILSRLDAIILRSSLSLHLSAFLVPPPQQRADMNNVGGRNFVNLGNFFHGLAIANNRQRLDLHDPPPPYNAQPPNAAPAAPAPAEAAAPAPAPANDPPADNPPAAPPYAPTAAHLLATTPLPRNQILRLFHYGTPHNLQLFRDRILATYAREFGLRALLNGSGTTQTMAEMTATFTANNYAADPEAFLRRRLRNLLVYWMESGSWQGQHGVGLGMAMLGGQVYGGAQWGGQFLLM